MHRKNIHAGTITISPKTIKVNEIQIKVSKNTPTGQSEILAPGDIGTSGVEGQVIKIITSSITYFRAIIYLSSLYDQIDHHDTL